MSCRKWITFLLVALLWASLATIAGAADVTGQVRVTATNGTVHSNREVSVVFWLMPISTPDASPSNSRNALPHPRLVQRNKTFDPHVVAVQVGSQVEFPNRDPFFHNVFSLFNGKRFDLGLYEAGSSRSVHFDRAGICFIFCNIHPQMSAVVVVVDTSYFAVSDPRGEFSIPQVPPGRYQLKLWEEHSSGEALKELSREVMVGEGTATLGTLQLRQSEALITGHLNKYGKQYDPEVFSSPVYIHP